MEGIYLRLTETKPLALSLAVCWVTHFLYLIKDLTKYFGL